MMNIADRIQIVALSVAAFGGIVQALTLIAFVWNLTLTRNQVAASQRSARISLTQLEESLRPIIVVTKLHREGGIVSAIVQNQGAGAAFDIRWLMGGEEPNELRKEYGQSLVLGPGACMDIKAEGLRDTKAIFV